MSGHKTISGFGVAVLCLALLSVTGCNFSAQSYNFGKLLTSGESLATVGVGSREYIEMSVVDPSIAPMSYSEAKGPSTFFSYSISTSYRIGILNKLPFGGGLDGGMHAEFPSQLDSGASVLLEFDTRLGLPSLEVATRHYYHNVAAGWIVGNWIDNGWFLEYAAGLEFRHLILYIGYRATLTATDPTSHTAWDDSYDGDEFSFGTLRESDRKVVMRSAVGTTIKLPRLPLLPDHITPEMTIMYPNYSILSQTGYSLHVGLQWLNGI